MFSISKEEYQKKEVNCTDPFPSVRLPWTGPRWVDVIFRSVFNEAKSTFEQMQ